VHGINRKASHGQRRKWTGWAVAFTVSLTVCNAGSALALSPQLYGGLPAFTFLSSFQIKRPEQKAPHDLNVIRVSSDQRISRSFASGAAQFTERSGGVQYLGVADSLGGNAFGSSTDSCESPRAPPLMDPPFFS
jgi:hypothetical protein